MVFGIDGLKDLFDRTAIDEFRIAAK